MDTTRYEKISGREAIRRLLNGEVLFDTPTTSIFLKPNPDELWTSQGIYQAKFELPFSVLISKEFYIKKPFDVRQAMRDKPDEWVAAFKTSENDWVKVGFDTSEFTVVGLELSNDAPLNAAHDYFKVCVYGTDLDACIPLDEVPADAR